MSSAMKMKILMTLFICTFLLSNASQGAVIDHVYDVTFDGVSYSEVYTGDSNLELNGSVRLNFLADVNDYWMNMTDATFWPGLLVGFSATRTGNYSWSYFLDGLRVSSGSKLNDSSRYSHIINLVGGYAGMFDRLTIDYILTSSTSNDSNTLYGDPSILWTNTPFDATYVDNTSGSVATDVPEPAVILFLVATGLAGLGFRRRYLQ